MFARETNSGWLRRGLVLACLVAAGATAVAAPEAMARSKPPRATLTDAPSRGKAKRARRTPRTSTAPIYWGAWVGNQFTGTEAPWDMTAATDFERLVGKGMSLIHVAAPFAYCSPDDACTFYSFPTSAMSAIRQHGSIPFLSWSSASSPVSSVEPRFQLRDVAAGDFDRYIRSFAIAARSWGHPFFLQFNWEMNGGWFPWGVLANHNTAADYVAAWRHVHDIFTSVGANNATWTWCPNIEFNGSYESLAGVYPGNSYVDWTCLDGYNWGTNPWKPNRWTSFRETFGWTYNKVVSIAPSKPIMLGELGSSEYGGSKAKWLADMLQTQLPRYFPKIKGFVWMEKYDGRFDWPVETSSKAKAAFAAGIQKPFYAGNTFATLGGTKVRPLG